MPGPRNARSIKVMLAVAGSIGVVALVAYVHPSKPASAPPPPQAVQTESPPVDQADGNEPLTGEPPPLGILFGCNSPAPPPVGFSVGRSPDEADIPDLSTPAVAVYTVLSLIDRAATDKLAPCFLEETEDPVSNLYPRYLGHPVALVDVIEEGQSAKIVWEATVHMAFSRHGKPWSPGETITLTARLVQVEGLWKLLQLHDGDEDGDQQHNASAN